MKMFQNINFLFYYNYFPVYDKSKKMFIYSNLFVSRHVQKNEQKTYMDSNFKYKLSQF
jgi:hypothetical protein